MTRPIPVVFNPTAGGGRARYQRKELEDAATREGVSLDWWATEAAGHAVDLAADAAGRGHPLVLAFGGDGTYNEVARGLLGTETAMGIVPAGTTSVLAYEFGVPRPVGVSLEALLGGVDRVMRVGHTDRDDIIVIMLSAGPDALVLENLMSWLKPLGGRVGVAFQAVIELMRPAPMPTLRAIVGNRSTECGWVIVGKSRCYAGPFHACPEADPFSPSFQIVLNRRGTRRSALAFSAALARGKHLSRPGVERCDLDTLRLEAVSGSAPLPYQVDGDFKGHLPVEISIHPKPLVVRLPRV
ncbi:MAG: diacylglycerol kinase family protein [Acidobacteriota bacterium]